MHERLNRSLISVNLYLGVAQTHAGQQDLALRQFQQCVELEPGYYRSYFFLGRNLAWLGRYDEAVEAFEKALSLTPDNIEALAFLGAALAGKGERQRALNIVKKVRAAGERTEPAVLIAAIYASLGLAAEMYEWLERAVAVKSTPIYIAAISNRIRSLPDGGALSQVSGVDRFVALGAQLGGRNDVLVEAEEIVGVVLLS